MKKIFSAIPFLFLGLCTYAQQLSQINFSGAATLSSFGFLTDQNVLIRISEDGKVIEWGIEWKSERNNNYYAPKLQPYFGRVDYYGSESDPVTKGKVKSIGTCVVIYYGSLETETQRGKVKSIGNTGLDYYNNFENTAIKGKLKFAGNLALEYYPSLENEAFRGKLKSVANTPITYYSTFDDKLIKGKIKSIGSVAYNWYTSLDRKELRGALKSGSYRQNINGVTYILR
jgi:hypothetical protein